MIADPCLVVQAASKRVHARAAMCIMCALTLRFAC